MSMRASRKDDGVVAVESLAPVQTPRGSLYTWTAQPAGSSSCVVICSSLFGDFTGHYHRERLLGQALAKAGHGVIRFHYAGEGNSEGDPSAMTFDSLCDDARAVIGHAESLGFKDFVLVGTRIGALVAAATVATWPSVPLVLWEPVTDPLVFFAQGYRAKRMSLVVNDRHPQATDWRQELEQNGVLDLFGYDVYPPLIQSLENVGLLAALGLEPRRMYIAGFQRGASTHAPTRAELTRRGFPVETADFDLSESWWFASEKVPRSGELISETAAWIAKVFQSS